MKLSRIFQSKADAFNETIVTNDLPRMRELFRKKDGFEYMLQILNGDSLQHMSKEMTELFIREMDGEVTKRWGFGDNSKSLVLSTLILHATRNKRADLVDLLIDSGINFNSDSGDSGLVRALVTSEIPDAAKLPFLKRMLAGGYEKITLPEGLVQAAVEKNFLGGVDLFASIGFDMHRNSEQYLRTAAKAGLKDLALHLVAAHKADINTAIRTSRELGAKDEWLFLEGLRDELPEAPLPVTLDGMAAEMAELKATVRELTAAVRELREPKALDKPLLKGPKQP